MRARSAAAAAAFGALAGVLGSVAAAPRLVWNTTASAPIGLYALTPTTRVARGDWVALRLAQPQGRWLADRGYLPSGALLIKRVAALAPSRVCRSDDRVTIDGALVAHAQPVDRWGRSLPQWSGCVELRASDLFLINPAQGSLDSRYLGPLPRASVVGRLHPLIVTRSSADAD